MPYTRGLFTVVYLLLSLVLWACASNARSSHKAMGIYVSNLMFSLIVPVVGNLIIIFTSSKFLATVGYYLYFIGLDAVMFAVLHFSIQHCRTSWPGTRLRLIIHYILLADIIQLLLNPLTGHAFALEATQVDGAVYYLLIPYLGQTLHRVICYAVFAIVLGMFFERVIHSPRIYVERYAVMLFSMVFTGIWETVYIFSRTPVDTSMLGFAIFGLLVYFFAFYYKPVRLLDSMLANVASEMNEALFFFDNSGSCIWANRQGVEMAGVQGEDYEHVNELLVRLFGESVKERGNWFRKFKTEQDGQTKYFLLENQIVMGARNRINASFLRVIDNTEEQLALEHEKYLASHDALTGLYTREYLYSRVQERVSASPPGTYALLFLDVDNFKMINDIFGSEFGDFVLKKLASLISSDLSGNSLFGRLSGDTFGICIPAADVNEQQAERNLSRFIVDNGTISHHILLHEGVYIVQEPQLDVSVMFDRAHMALATVKNDYNRHVAFYSEKIRDEVIWNQEISNDLAEAIEKRQIFPYLQPVVDGTGHIIGAEALVRWNHPKHGFLSPASFIPVFEKNGIIAQVDRYMWRSACEILARWKKTGRDLFLSVNISPKDFYFMDVAAEIRALVHQYGIDPDKLRLEITETVMMTDVENRIRIIEELREDGFMVEMDDFGSGYSSFNMLKDMPVDVIKIDMMFLRESQANSRAQTILRDIISLSNDLGIDSLTEGVENRPQYQMLSQMGCKMFQGYYFAKPLAVDAFEAFAANAS